MAWVKLDDTFWMNPKIVMAGEAATGIYARLLAYCGCYLTDGLIPAGMVDAITKNRKALDALEEHGLITRMESGSVLIRNYLEYNRSKAEIEADRATRRANGKRGGRPANPVTGP
jgi:hypothetical protein